MIPKKNLPIEEDKRWDFLYNCFNNQHIICDDLFDNWFITFDVFPTVEWYVDPRLKEGLDWWGLKNVRKIPFSYKLKKNGIASLNDTWTLYEWVRWFEKNSHREFKKITIIHLDEHDDMMSPHLLKTKDGLEDIFSGILFDFSSNGICKSIESSAIEIGSFFTPFLNALSDIDIEIRHLGQKLCKERENKNFLVKISSRKTHPIFPACKLLTCDLLRKNITDSGNITYRFFSSIEDGFNFDGKNPVLLHIDMDYFCNRYEGCSDWMQHSDRHDPPFIEISNQIHLVNKGIQHISKMVESTSIAFSPGFFPAEYWESSYKLLTENLISCGLWEDE